MLHLFVVVVVVALLVVVVVVALLVVAVVVALLVVVVVALLVVVVVVDASQQGCISLHQRLFSSLTEYKFKTTLQFRVSLATYPW